MAKAAARPWPDGVKGAAMKTAPNKSALRILEIVKLLKGRSLTGLSNSEIAKTLKTSPQNISRDLATLVEAGFAAKLDGDRYALGIALLQIAKAHDLELERGRRKIEEIESRVNAGA